MTEQIIDTIAGKSDPDTEHNIDILIQNIKAKITRIQSRIPGDVAILVDAVRNRHRITNEMIHTMVVSDQSRGISNVQDYINMFSSVFPLKGGSVLLKDPLIEENIIHDLDIEKNLITNFLTKKYKKRIIKIFY